MTMGSLPFLQAAARWLALPSAAALAWLVPDLTEPDAL